MSAEGVDVVVHAGRVATRLLAGRMVLPAALSKPMVCRNFTPLQDRGRVLTDVAVMLADGEEAIADIDVLRHRAGVLGPVASPPTVWRKLDEVAPGRFRRIQTARRRVRRHVVAQLINGILLSRPAGTDAQNASEHCVT